MCVECLRGLLQGLVSSQDLSGLREELLTALEAAEASQDVLMDAPNCYYVSKTWVGGFKRRTGGTKSTLEPPTAGEDWAGAFCMQVVCLLAGLLTAPLRAAEAATCMVLSTACLLSAN